jgi:putative photosynthetic complex assembly protein 2
MVLWWMRLSAKLNVFLGAPALSEAFLPEHLRYLERFFSKKPMNALFPVSITVSTVITVFIVQAARAADVGVFEATGASFLATLMALAILEHWLLVVPLPTDALWSWGLRSHKATASAAEAERSGSVVLLQRRRDDAGAAFEQEAAKRRRDR